MKQDCCLTRYNWQTETLNALKEKAGIEISLPNDKIGVRLLLLFGYPQMGKTEILLSLLNIRSDAKKHIAELLRAGQETSNSSTSTAIMYHKSNGSVKWGIKKQYIGENSSSKTEYFDEDGIKNYLHTLRAKLENGDAEFKRHIVLLNVFIPQQYFSENTNDYLSIIDFPGIDSSNDKERRYVNSLADRLVPLADKIVLVCGADRVTELGTIKIPGLEDLVWTDDPQRYLVVPTYAFTRQAGYCIDAYNKNPSGFTDSVLGSCRKAALENIPLKAQKHTLIEPIEVGRSLDTLEEFNLWKNSNLPDDFFISIRKAVEKQTEKIKSALTSAGDTDPLRARLICYRQIKNRYNKEINSLEAERKIKKAAKESAELSQSLAKQLYESKTEEYNSCQQKRKRLNKNYSNILQDAELKGKRIYVYTIKNWVLTQVHEVSDFNDSHKQQRLLSDLREEFFDHIKDNISKSLVYTDYKINMPQTPTFSYNLLDQISDNFSWHISNLFFLHLYDSRENVSENVAKVVVPELKNWYNELIANYEKDYNRCLASLKNDCFQAEMALKDADSKKTMAEEHYQKKLQDIQDLERRIGLAHDQKNLKLSFFENWKCEAGIHFSEQTNGLRLLIEKENNGIKKMEMFLLLCLIIEDYDRLIKEEDICG